LTSGLVARGQSDASLVKSWGKDVVPLFSHEWMSKLLLQLLLFKVSWVFSGCHKSLIVSKISSGFYKESIPS